MSKRELKALQAAPIPASPPAAQPEPEAEAEDDQVAAEAARLQRVQEQIEAELTRARESVKSFAEAFGRREPVDGEVASWRSSLCCLVASAPDIGHRSNPTPLQSITTATMLCTVSYSRRTSIASNLL